MWSYCNHVAGDDLLMVDVYTRIFMYACIHTSAVPVQSTAMFDKPVLLPGSLCKILVILKSLKIWNISSPRVSGDRGFMNNDVAVEFPYSGHYNYRPEPRLRGSHILSSWSLVLELTPEASHAWLRILWIQWITLRCMWWCIACLPWRSMTGCIRNTCYAHVLVRRIMFENPWHSYNFRLWSSKSVTVNMPLVLVELTLFVQSSWLWFFIVSIWFLP